MTPFRQRIIGLVRFSYPARGGFAREFATDEEARAFLFEEGRLGRRMALWEAMCLPGLAAQTDRGFTLLVLTGQSLPDWAKERLREGLARLPDARLVAMGPKPHYAAIKAAFGEVAAEGETHRVTFRLDDDDALAKDYVETLRRRARRVARVGGWERPVVLAFNRGLYVDTASRRIFDATERLPLSVGTAMVAPSGHDDNVYARNHRLLPEFYDTWQEATTPMWIRTVHGDNDSEPTVVGRTGLLDSAGIDAALGRFARGRAALEAL